MLDLGQVVAGNFCGGLLAYFGADVIKVEPPGRGDALRHLRTLDAGGTSLWWRSYGRNRRCMTVDLHNEEGRGLVRRLAAKCDVLVENFRPGGWGLPVGQAGQAFLWMGCCWHVATALLCRRSRGSPPPPGRNAAPLQL